MTHRTEKFKNKDMRVCVYVCVWFSYKYKSCESRGRYLLKIPENLKSFHWGIYQEEHHEKNLWNYVLFVMVSNKVALMAQEAIQILPFKRPHFLVVGSNETFSCNSPLRLNTFTSPCWGKWCSLSSHGLSQGQNPKWFAQFLASEK